MALTGEQARRRVHPDPARPGYVHLRPGVQIGEIGSGSRWTVERLDVGGQLYQVARHEPGGETHLPKNRHHQPGRVAARTDSGSQCHFGVCTPGSSRRLYPMSALTAWLSATREVDGASPRRNDEIAHPGLDEFPWAGTLFAVVDRSEIDVEVVPDLLRVGKKGTVSA